MAKTFFRRELVCKSCDNVQDVWVTLDKDYEFFCDKCKSRVEFTKEAKTNDL